MNYVASRLLLAIIVGVIVLPTSAYRPLTYRNTASDNAVTNYINTRYNGDRTTATSNTDTTTPEIRKVASDPNSPVPRRRTKWGVDNTCPGEYWFDSRIHTLGNHGFWGAVHAALAPASTAIIDVAAYDGIDIRRQVGRIL
jgi:hypothetical protein